MSAQSVTLVSGVLLLVLFALVGWNLRRRRRDANDPRDEQDPDRHNRL